MNNNIKELFNYLKQYKGDLLIVFFSLFIVAISLLLVGAVFKHLVDNGLNENHVNVINKAILLISILIIMFAIGSFFRSYFINLVTEKIISRIKIESYSKLLQVEIATFEELKIGDIISRLSTDLEAVGSLIINFLSFFIRNFIMLIGAIIMMFAQSTKLSMLIIISVPVLLIPLLRISKHVRSMSKKIMIEKSDMTSFIEETFSGIRTFYAFNQQNRAVKMFEEKISVYLKHASKRLKFRSMFFALAIMVISGSIIIVIWVGSIDIVNRTMTSGQMVSFIYYAMIVGMSAGGIAELLSEIQGPLAALDRIFELKSIVIPISNIKVTNINLKKTFNNYDIDFEDVSFSYPSRKNILALDNISFNIKHGQFTGIVGKSGSGKSTIMQLLFNFYQNQSGVIKINNQDISSYNIMNLRKIIAYVEQDPSIFSGTIKSNIIFSNPEATDEEIDNVVNLCGINQLIKNLPEGINTEIGEKGIRMSGGQKQRIAIARAILYKPEILFLDEATSALDNEGEKEILENIKKFMPGLTIVSIAHRILSVQEADNIIVIDQGKIVSDGKHQDLLKKCDIYLALFLNNKKT